ncbi:hypothetical protein [Pontimicrobium sp. MEBiC01747]
MKKIIFALIMLIGFSFSGFSQSDKMKEKANQKIKKINSQITKGNESVALTNEQKEKIYALEIEKLKKIKSLRKEIKDKSVLKEKIKALNKEEGKEISQNILTKEQKVARRIAKKKSEE